MFFAESLNHYHDQAGKEGRRITLVERLEGIYRMFTGRLNRPDGTGHTISSGGSWFSAWKCDYPSQNHYGYYDIFTLTIPYHIESIFSGFASASGSSFGDHSNQDPGVMWFLFSPVWVPLNLVRAAFGAVFMVFAFIPTVWYHYHEEARADKAERHKDLRVDKITVTNLTVEVDGAEQTKKQKLDLNKLNDINFGSRDEEIIWKVTKNKETKQFSAEPVLKKDVDFGSADKIIVESQRRGDRSKFEDFSESDKKEWGQYKICDLSTIKQSRPAEPSTIYVDWKSRLYYICNTSGSYTINPPGHHNNSYEIQDSCSHSMAAFRIEMSINNGDIESLKASIEKQGHAEQYSHVTRVSRDRIGEKGYFLNDRDIRLKVKNERQGAPSRAVFFKQKKQWERKTGVVYYVNDTSNRPK